MTTLQEIEAALPNLSAEELAQVETLIQSVRREKEEEAAAVPTPESAAAEPTNRAKRKMVKDSFGNGLWVLEAVPGVVVTTEMVKKIQEEIDEEEFQNAMRFYRGRTAGPSDGDKI